jgi:hypothetical protein
MGGPLWAFFSPYEHIYACHSERSEESLATRGFFAALRMKEK